jgi:hypothetical protein
VKENFYDYEIPDNITELNAVFENKKFYFQPETITNSKIYNQNNLVHDSKATKIFNDLALLQINQILFIINKSVGREL